MADPFSGRLLALDRLVLEDALHRLASVQLEAAAVFAVLNNRLDLIDGDPDLELNGDELDGNHAEDDFVQHSSDGPGCPLADPDKAVDDEGCDDINDDREQDGDRVPHYGIDQTKPALPWHLAYFDDR